MSVPTHRMIKLHFEVIAYKTHISIIYIQPSGHTVSEIVHVSEKLICQFRSCVYCKEVFEHYHCLPKFIKYIFRILIVASVLDLLSCMKFIFKSVIFNFQSIFARIFMCFKLCKFIPRRSLLLGAFIGSSARNLLQNFYFYYKLMLITDCPLTPFYLSF